MSKKRKVVVDLTVNDSRSAAFDPKLLLSPRAALRKQASSPEKEFNVVSAIEKLHGVQERKGPVAKRREQDPTKQNAQPQRGGSGIVGKDLQDASKKQVEKSWVLYGRSALDPSNAITISDGEDESMLDNDDDVQVMPGNTTNWVCFGMLKASVNAFSIPTASTILPTQWPRINCDMECGNGNIIHVKTDAKRFGVISSDTAGPLHRILQLGLCRCDGRIPTRPRYAKEGENLSGVSAILPFEIIVYGDAGHKDRISTILSQKNVFLIQPTAYDQQFTYVNPHVRQSFKASDGLQYGTSTFKTAEEIKTEIESLFNKIQNSASLSEHAQPSTVKTTLLKHQRQALTFCLDHEDESLNAEDYSVWRVVTSAGKKTWRNKFTPQVLYQQPTYSAGGIIADEMGLGKTLSMLSLICESQSKAVTHADGSSKVKATLIVCPLSVLSNWTEQINNHVDDSLYRVLIHHDKTRCYDLKSFSEYDIVLTTYAAVANEYKHRKDQTKRTILPKVEFFRIVLDEAHTIKEISTQNSQAAIQLSGLNRWCLTATPVQNSLNDLAALFAFLKVSPFDSRQVWNQYISQPMKSGDSIAVSRLQTLLKMKVLRRTKDQGENADQLLSLPSRREEIRLLKLSDDEQQVYNNYLEFYQKRAKGLGKLMTTINVLQNINQLRQICIAMALLPKLDPKPVESDQEKVEEMTEEELLELIDGEVCSICKSVIEIQDDDSEACYSPKCLHFFCGEHGAPRTNNVKCNAPGCKGFGPLLPLHTKSQPVEAARGKKRFAESPPYSTKIKALLTDLTTIEEEVRPDHAGASPTKSVVFSQFTSFLDIIALALQDLGMQFARLDGSMNREERTTQLNTFRDNPKIRVMLVSTRAGGVGLNLTMANKVFLMEPAWNPSIESQACDRVHRIGQTKPVSYTRYIVEESIEQTMYVSHELTGYDRVLTW